MRVDRFTRCLAWMGAVVFAGVLSVSHVQGAGAGPLAQGLEQFRAGRFAEAEPLLVEGLKASPKDLDGLLALTEVYLRKDDYEKAIPIAKRAVAAAPASSMAHLRLAQSYGEKAIKISKVRAAFLIDDIKQEYETAISLDPKNVDAREGLMEFYMEVPSIMGGSLDKARAEAEAIVPLDAPRGLFDVAKIAAEQGKESDVLEAMTRLSKTHPAKACMGRAWYYGNKKKDEQRAAAELLKVADITPKSAEDLTLTATQLQQMKRWNDALRMLDQATAADPAYLPAHYQIGRACLLSKTDLPRAEVSFKKYLSAEPVRGMPSRAAAHWRLGEVYQEMGRKDDARREIQEAVRQEPKNEDFKKSLATLG